MFEQKQTPSNKPKEQPDNGLKKRFLALAALGFLTPLSGCNQEEVKQFVEAHDFSPQTQKIISSLESKSFKNLGISGGGQINTVPLLGVEVTSRSIGRSLEGFSESENGVLIRGELEPFVLDT